MFQLFDQAARYIDEHAIQLIDLKFYDLWGRWHHLTVPASQFTPGILESGIGFDGSAVGLKSVKAGDMVLVPDHNPGL
jgi:glutamine synthetase